MFYLLYKAMEEADVLGYYKAATCIFLVWIIVLKYIKVLAHFKKHPCDIPYFPAYLLFGHWCTLVKIWALLTCWNASWATAKVSNEADQAKDAEQNTTEEEEVNAVGTASEHREGLGSRASTRLRRATTTFVCAVGVV